MNKRNINERFDFARRYDPDSWFAQGSESQSSVEIEKSPQDSLLSIIYAPDPLTGLPTGDIQYFVSDKANPDVKAFILDNLMRDVSAGKNVANPSGLSDDALLELSRGRDESVQEYAQRLRSEVDSFKFLREQLSKSEQPSDKVEDVPVGSE